MDLWEAQLHAPIVDRGAHQHREGGSPHPKASPYARSQPRSSYLVKRVEGEPAALQIQAESKPKHKDQAAAAVVHTRPFASMPNGTPSNNRQETWGIRGL